jgi:hypothetical protein
MMEGVNSAMIHCITFVNVSAYPQHNNNMTKKRDQKSQKKESLKYTNFNTLIKKKNKRQTKVCTLKEILISESMQKKVFTVASSYITIILVFFNVIIFLWTLKAIDVDNKIFEIPKRT